VRVEYDPEQISYPTLLAVFFRQPHSRKAKKQYSSAIWYSDDDQRAAAEAAVADRRVGYCVEVLAASAWHDAEEYHQDYYMKHAVAACSR
jgi:peptide methionine sulfoxide reductase MsrA